MIFQKAWRCGTSPFSSRSFRTHILDRFTYYLRRYLFLFDNVFTLGLFTSATVALLFHKIMMLELHRPLSIWGVIFGGPFLFVFDFVTMVVLYHGLASTRIAWRIEASIVTILIIFLSATFASLYFEANAELNWNRSFQVFIKYDTANYEGCV